VASGEGGFLGSFGEAVERWRRGIFENENNLSILVCDEWGSGYMRECVPKRFTTVISFFSYKKKLNEIANLTSGGNKSGHIWVSIYHFSSF